MIEFDSLVLIVKKSRRFVWISWLILCFLSFGFYCNRMATPIPAIINTILDLYGKISTSITAVSGEELRGNYARCFQAWLMSRVPTVKFDIQARKFITDPACVREHSALVVTLLRSDSLTADDIALLRRLILNILKANRSGQARDPNTAVVDSVDEKSLELLHLSMDMTIRNLLDSVLYERWLEERNVHIENSAAFTSRGSNLSASDLRQHESKNAFLAFMRTRMDPVWNVYQGFFEDLYHCMMKACTRWIDWSIDWLDWSFTTFFCCFPGPGPLAVH